MRAPALGGRIRQAGHEARPASAAWALQSGRAVPTRIRNYFSMIRTAWAGFREAQCHQTAAVLALHLITGTIALGIVTAWVAGAMQLEVAWLSAYVHDLIGANAGGVFDKLLLHAHSDWQSWVPVVGVFAVFVLNVVSVMRIVQNVINTAVGVERVKARKYRPRIALKRIAGTAFVALVSVGLAASFSAKTALEVLDYLGVDPIAATPWAFRVVEIILALMLATLLFGGVFRLLPDAKVKLHHIGHAAFWAAKLYTLAQIVAAFAIVYVGSLSFYGEAAILLVLIGYLYASAVSFMWGAQVLRVQVEKQEAVPRPSLWAERSASQMIVREAAAAH
jgi:membrane protein